MRQAMAPRSMSKERGEALATPETGLFRNDGNVRGLSFARRPQSKRRCGGIGIDVRNSSGAWLRTQLSVERRDFYWVFAEAARQVAAHGGIAFNEKALRPRLREASAAFLRRYGLRVVRVCFQQVIELDEERDPQAEVRFGARARIQPAGARQRLRPTGVRELPCNGRGGK